MPLGSDHVATGPVHDVIGFCRIICREKMTESRRFRALAIHIGDLPSPLAITEINMHGFHLSPIFAATPSTVAFPAYHTLVVQAIHSHSHFAKSLEVLCEKSARVWFQFLSCSVNSVMPSGLAGAWSGCFFP